MLKPWLWLPPALAHKLSPTLLKSLNWMVAVPPPVWRPFTWRGLEFPNRVGIAGGVDKDVENVRAWWNLGAGFVEVGTITPLSQNGNTPPVLARDTEHEALWNRLGFPSRGLVRARQRLLDLKRPFPTPLFANIGKNASSPLSHAHEDYIELCRELAGLVDGFVINISSPNTQGLRELLKPDRLSGFLKPILDSLPEQHAPMLLKLSPDLDDEELERALITSYEMGIDGWVLTNTSLGAREGLNFPVEGGGVSGRPLAEPSKIMLQKALRILGPQRNGKLVISVGGVMDGDDIIERLSLGADLVQVYTALVFAGPWFFRKVGRAQRNKEGGRSRLGEVVPCL